MDYKLTSFDESISEADLVTLAEQHRPQLERYAGLFVNDGLAIKKAVLFLNVGKLIAL